jgi:hypothetical protein
LLVDGCTLFGFSGSFLKVHTVSAGSMGFCKSSGPLQIFHFNKRIADNVANVHVAIFYTAVMCIINHDYIIGQFR